MRLVIQFVKTALFMLLVNCMYKAYSQDTLVMKIGKQIPVKDATFSEEKIKFRDKHGRHLAVRCDDVWMVKWRNGTHQLANPNNEVISQQDFALLGRKFGRYKNAGKGLLIGGLCTLTIGGMTMMFGGMLSEGYPRPIENPTFVAGTIIFCASAALIGIGGYCLYVSRTTKRKLRAVQPPIAFKATVIKNDVAILRNGMPAMPAVAFNYLF